MCTVTWRRDADGYRVFFNRDAPRAGPPATPPALRERAGVRFLAPALGASGATWLAVNEVGLAIGLLGDAAPAARPGAADPGALVAALADARSQDEVAARLRLDVLAALAPFQLLVWAPGHPVHWHRWDGLRRLATVLSDEDLPVTTSAFDPDGVAAARRARYGQFVARHGPPTDLALAEFHRSTDARGGAYSVFMTRPDAETVSYSRVTVAPRAIRYYYAARSAGEAFLPLGQSVVLEAA